MSKVRNSSLNILKAICCILIVFNHCKFPSVFGKLLENYARIGVPIFFLISGYYLNGNSKEKIKSKIWKNMKLLFFSCIIYLLLNCIRYFVDKEATIGYFRCFINVKNILDFIFFNVNPFWGHLWFIHALIYLYVIEFILLKYNLNNKKVGLSLSVILLITYQIINGLFVDDFLNNIQYIRNYIFVGIPFFTIGKYISSKPFNKKINIVLSVVSFFGLTIEILLYRNELYVFSILLAILLFKFTLDYKDYKNKTLEYIGDKLSMYIYILHPAVKWIYIYLFIGLNIHFGVYLWIEPVLMFLTVVLLSNYVYRVKNNNDKK